MPYKAGVLLQFFDTSKAYGFADKHVYAAISGGKPYGKKKPSVYYCDPNNVEFPEFRLVITNKGVLNPNSPLEIKRYMRVEKNALQTYEKCLREYFCSLPRDEKKVQKYREKLLKYWAWGIDQQCILDEELLVA